MSTDWEIAPLGKIATIKYGKNLPTSDLSDKGYPVFGANGIIGFHSKYLYKSEQVLISCRGAYSGKINWSPPNCFVTNNSLILELENEDLDFKKYLYYALHTVDKSKLVTGSAQPQVTINNAVVLEIPLAPPHLRKPIVAEIEKQFSRLDEAVTALKRIQANLKRYKAAVLKAAVEGKLTEQWREEHPDVEPADQLLKRILDERRAKWEAEALAKMKAKGSVGARHDSPDSWKKKYKEPAGPDTANLPELPEGWVWASVGQCFRVAVGATPSRKESSFWNGDIPWVSSGEVQFSRVRGTRELITQKGLESSSTQINPPGSVLLGMIGEGKTRGQAAILEIPAANNQNCAAIWVSETPVKAEYIYYWLMQRYEETRRIGSGNNQQALNKAIIEMMPFPLPPLSEHPQILEEIDRRLSVTEELEATTETNLKRAERLRQSILSIAFAPNNHRGGLNETCSH
jgi:type I restriction enzyme S subunit